MTHRERAIAFLSAQLLTEKPPEGAVRALTHQFEIVDASARVEFADKLQGLIESEANGPGDVQADEAASGGIPDGLRLITSKGAST